MRGSCFYKTEEGAVAALIKYSRGFATVSVMFLLWYPIYKALRVKLVHAQVVQFSFETPILKKADRLFSPRMPQDTSLMYEPFVLNGRAFKPSADPPVQKMSKAEEAPFMKAKYKARTKLLKRLKGKRRYYAKQRQTKPVRANTTAAAMSPG